MALEKHVSGLENALDATLTVMNNEDKEDKFRDWTFSQQENIESSLQQASKVVYEADAMFTGKEDLSQLTEEKLREKAAYVRELSRKCSILSSDLTRSEQEKPESKQAKPARQRPVQQLGELHREYLVRFKTWESQIRIESKQDQPSHEKNDALPWFRSYVHEPTTEDVLKNAVGCQIPGVNEDLQSFFSMVSADEYVYHEDGCNPDIDLLQYESIWSDNGSAAGRLDEMASLAHNLGHILSDVSSTRRKRLAEQQELEKRAMRSKGQLEELALLLNKHALRFHIGHSDKRMKVLSKKFAGFHIGQLEKIHSECEMTRDRITEELVFRRLKSGIGLPMSTPSLHLPNSPHSTTSYVMDLE